MPRHLSLRKGKSKARLRPSPEVRFGPNPGIQNQATAVGLTEEEMQDPELMENLETQFWNVDKVHDLVERQKRTEKELMGFYQVLRKNHREEKLPLMLLWDEKLEIKALHAQDPKNWTVMKLAFSYPANPTIIQKILKTKWKLRTQEEIDAHDRRVRRNWEAFAEGKLKISDKFLEKHLKSFSNRSKLIAPISKDVALVQKENENPLKSILKDGGVFGNIYASYQQLKDHNVKERSAEEKEEDSVIEAGLKVLEKPPMHDTFIIPQSVSGVTYRTSNPTTLEEMRKKVLHDLKKEENLTNVEHAFVKHQFDRESDVKKHHRKVRDPVGCATTVTDDNNDGSAEESSSAVDTNLCQDHKYVNLKRLSELEEKENTQLAASFQAAKEAMTDEESAALTKVLKERISKCPESYPLQIEIPKDLYKRGALYRVKDRFYTDDGEFLYRVPGLVIE